MAVKRLAAMLFVTMIFSAWGVWAQQDFEAMLSSMPVVPGSPADVERQQSQSASEPTEPQASAPASAPESQIPSSEPASQAPVSAPQAASQSPPVSYVAPAPVSSRPYRPSQSSQPGSSEESSVPEPEPESRGGIAYQGTVSLPSAGEVSGAGELIASGTEVVPERNLNWIGIASWVCIALGVIVVVAVLFSTVRRPPQGGSGRKRYRRKPYRSKRKRLLSDKYYRDHRY